jgi:hypothetical protein
MAEEMIELTKKAPHRLKLVEAVSESSKGEVPVLP